MITARAVRTWGWGTKDKGQSPPLPPHPSAKAGSGAL